MNHDVRFMPEVRFQNIALADAPALSRLHGAAFAEWGQEAWSSNAFGDLLDSDAVWGRAARSQGNVIVAFLLLQTSGGDAEILTLATDPAWRQRGIARRLLRSVIDDFSAAGGRRLYLEVRADNAPALSLYRGAGFSNIAARRNYYRDTRTGELHTALILVRDLGTCAKSPA